jgi:ribosomal-protein-alanine N-acetyltransferase
MKIRLAQIQDLDEITAIDCDVNLTYWTRSEYLECLNNKTQSIYALESSNNEIIGAVALSVAYDEAEILQFCIKRVYHGRGYGKILLRRIIEILQFARFVQRIFLEVRDGNVAAINLYKSCGFNIVGRRANYYTVDNWQFDAVIMLLCVGGDSE